MLKYLAAVSVIFGCAVYVSCQYQRHAHNRDNQTGNAVASGASTNKAENGKEHEDDTTWNPPRWYRLFSWPDGLTVWGVLLTLAAVAEQTNETRKAAIATQAAASASLKQVGLMEVQNKAAQDEQRARLHIDFPPENPSPRGLRIVDRNGDETLMVNIVLKVFNHGETKAFNVRASGYFFTGGMTIGKIYPSHGTSLSVQTIIGVADAEHPVFIPMASAPFGDYILMPSQDWNQVQNGDKSISVVGAIDYDDVYGVAHITPFHFEWGITRDRGFGYSAAWNDQSSATT